MKFVKKDKIAIGVFEKKKYFDFRKPIVCFLVVSLASCIISWLPYRRIGMPDSEIISLNDFLYKGLPYCMFLGCLAFVISYFWNIKYNTYPFFEEKYIWLSCGGVRKSKYFLNCGCGGEYNKKSLFKKE